MAGASPKRATAPPRPPAAARPHLPPRGAPPASPLDKPAQFVRGVGPHRAKLLAGVGVETVGDLVEYFPFRFEHQPKPKAIDQLAIEEYATIVGVVESVRGGGGFGSSNVNARVSDGTGTVRVTWFNAPHMRERLRRGDVLRLYGRVGEFEDLAQFANPSVEWLDADADPRTWDYERLVPVYRGTGILTSPQIARLVEAALDEAKGALQRETLPEAIRAKHGFGPRGETVEAMHRPTSPEKAEAARRRLAFEELFLMQLAIGLQRRWSATKARAPKLAVTDEIDARIRKRFPFRLTGAQDRVVREIAADLARDRPMVRLLQGDVGSGKTVVALYAALAAVANKTQCAILAPTEVLAAQHFAGIERYLAGSRVERCLLTGKTPKAERERIVREIGRGRMNLIVGTHAILQEDVGFASLGLVIVDEQHKFGVSQRATLRGKSRGNGSRAQGPPVVPHYLVMTATPIPRTLSMTVFGDLDASVIDQLPPGRQPVVTRIIREKQESEAWLEVRRRLAGGEQAYVVYPLVEESDALDLKAATTEVQRMARDLLPGARVGLMHGRLKGGEKQKVMREFASGKLDVLVSTTVVEVGVDVANATVMVVQHAERYGLSALHQLRGRVGRGTKPSLCLLMTDSRGGTAGQRLSVLCETNDGFRIAEEDLKLRGPGELLGTRQHGLPELRVANLIDDVDVLMRARDDAAQIVRGDPSLRDPAHGGLKAELRRRFRETVAFIDIG